MQTIIIFKWLFNINDFPLVFLAFYYVLKINLLGYLNSIYLKVYKNFDNK